MGYENTQYIIARHHDTDHPHIHLVVNRIDNEGKRISDQNEKLRSTKTCMELTKKHSLYVASGKENVKEYRLKEPDKTKYEIYHALQSGIVKSKNWPELEATLLKAGITTEFRYNGSTDKIQGVRFTKNGYSFNGSKIDRTCSYSNISYQLHQNDRIEQDPILQTSKHNQQDNTMGLSSVAETAASTLGGLFDLIQPIQTASGYDEEQAEVLRQEAKRRKKKKGRRL